MNGLCAIANNVRNDSCASDGCTWGATRGVRVGHVFQGARHRRSPAFGQNDLCVSPINPLRAVWASTVWDRLEEQMRRLCTSELGGSDGPTGKKILLRIEDYINLRNCPTVWRAHPHETLLPICGTRNVLPGIAPLLAGPISMTCYYRSAVDQSLFTFKSHSGQFLFQ